MLQRCLNPSNPAYRHYGGRGITVCDRWLKFVNFLADMGTRPAGLTLERIDNDGDYTPEHCCWITQAEQLANRRIKGGRPRGLLHTGDVKARIGEGVRRAWARKREAVHA
jgi:hypothetical protein